MKGRSVALILAAIGVALFAAVVVVGAWRVAGLILALQTATEPPAVIVEEPDTLDPALVRWASDPELPDGVSADEIAAAYAGAWAAWDEALASGIVDDLDRSFAGPALLAVVDGIPESVAGDVRLRSTGHQLTVAYVHPEGWMVVLQDRGVQVSRTWAEDHGINMEEEYQVMMVLEEGRWVVRQFIRIDAGQEAR